jgi:hypothetical protein
MRALRFSSTEASSLRICGAIASGIHTSNSIPRIVPRKAAGATPTRVTW